MSTETLGLQECADFLRVGLSTAQELADIGELPGTKVGKEWVFIKDDIATWLRKKIEQDQAQRVAISRGAMKPQEFTAAVPNKKQRRKIPELPENA